MPVISNRGPNTMLIRPPKNKKQPYPIPYAETTLCESRRAAMAPAVGAMANGIGIVPALGNAPGTIPAVAESALCRGRITISSSLNMPLVASVDCLACSRSSRSSFILAMRSSRESMLRGRAGAATVS